MKNTHEFVFFYVPEYQNTQTEYPVAAPLSERSATVSAGM